MIEIDKRGKCLFNTGILQWTTPIRGIDNAYLDVY
jgi:hypothetical protein